MAGKGFSLITIIMLNKGGFLAFVIFFYTVLSSAGPI